MKKKKISGKAKTAIIILLVLAVGLLGFSIYKLVGINQSYKEADNFYDQIEQAVKNGGNKTSKEAAAVPPAPEVPSENSLAEAESVPPKTPEEAKPEAASEPEQTEDAEVPEQPEDAEATAGKRTTLIPRVENDYWKNHEPMRLTPENKPQTAFRNFRYASMSWDYEALLDLCEDSVGWIYQEDTLSYPVVQADDNNKYLRHMLNGQYNIAGTLFVDYRFDQAGLNGLFSTIYGHNMDDKSMFGSITAYKNKDYYDKHPEFEIYVGNAMYAYEVYAAFQVEIANDLFTYYNVTGDELMEMKQEIDRLRPYKTNAPEITPRSHVVMLITCIDYPRDYDYRYVVILVRKQRLLDPESEPLLEGTALPDEAVES
ncbi:MAG: sortase [Parasporobacterium sp.]|nr:sortase [Parasporobacterium sp.]